jgi:hypothetical protein
MRLVFGSDQTPSVILIEKDLGNRSTKKIFINWASVDYLVRMVDVLVLKGFRPCLAL